MRILFRFVVSGFLALLAAVPASAASTILVTDVEVGSGAAGFFSSPVARLTFTDVALDTVTLVIESLLVNPPCANSSTCSAGITVLFNVDPNFDPQYLSFSSVTKQGTFVTPILFGGRDGMDIFLGPHGSGWDVFVNFYGTDFDAGDIASYTITAPGLTAASFNFAQADGDYALAVAVQSGSLQDGHFYSIVTYFADTDGTAVPTSFQVCPLYDQTKAVRSGSTVPIKLTLCAGDGRNQSSSSIVVTAVSLTQVSSGAPGAVTDTGNANPDNNFRFDSALAVGGGYIFNLKTTGLGTGTYNLNFFATGDAVMHAVQFQVK